MKILRDENVPTKVKYAFGEGFETYTVKNMGWLGKKNGELLGLPVSCANFHHFIGFSYILMRMTYQVDILNPNADKLLQDLADLKLISLSKTSGDPFMSVVKKLRKKAASVPPTLEDITKEVEFVRSKRYANKSKA